MENKIINGDCLEIMKNLESNSIDLILTDPPYGMNYQSSRRTEQHDKIALDENTNWFLPFIKEAYRILKDNTHIYIFCNDYAISKFRDEMELVGFTPKRTLVWVKNNHTSGDLEGDYANKTEFILYAHKGRRLLNGGRETNVLFFNRVNTDKHPTKKPEDLCAFLIKKSTNENEVVLDPFCGAGTTCASAKQLKRNFIGIELDPKYCKIAEDRIKSISNTLF